ncbi:type IV secretion protein Rhs [Flavobacterium sp. NKUCC04_CG]|uniref:type IV secretion protein Rhs n=1 Tax=Flavobacterium sp. NKUCC04_CG TaxID=2842121 RepID=UPI001C5BA661|nr:type IV secretion protein Rhs [Flavobacterium sp. NKUCC04_CG]MBW3520169.1 type IV secretion protein Rhs [Flavobacterium sp. NKUCC04_CG]
MIGEEVTITGEKKQEAFQELQKSVQKELNLTMDEKGKVDYTKIKEGKVSEDSQQLIDAIDDESISVNVKAENTMKTEAGDIYVGGAYSGNSVIKTEKGNSVVAVQEINPIVFGKVGEATGKPGIDVLHEVTEAYQGGLIAQKNGISSPSSINKNSTWPLAHSRATKESGSILQRTYDAKGMLIRNGSSTIQSADWSVKNRKGNRIILQSINR